MTRNLPLYDNGTLKRGDKSDYIWNTESALGVSQYQDLFRTPLAARFPTFAKLLAVNSTTKDLPIYHPNILTRQHPNTVLLRRVG